VRPRRDPRTHLSSDPDPATRNRGPIRVRARHEHDFPTKVHFASWNGTAPLDASSGEQTRHRLSRAGNPRMNRALHIMAIVQLRPTTDGRRRAVPAVCRVVPA
jgi:transposase